MTNILNKLWASKATLFIIVWVLVFAYAYNLEYIKKSIPRPAVPVGRTVEEIIATSVDKTLEPAWDNDFKSSIEAVK